jgi:putative MATE family efflux protein
VSSAARDLTKGIIWTQLLSFALPLLGSSLIQQLYNTVDLLFVGNLLGKEAAAAVGASSLIITCVLGFFTGLSVGAGIMIAQRFGNKSMDGLEQSVHTSVGLSFAGGVILTAVGYAGAPLFLQWLNTPDEILVQAVSYIRIYFLSLTSIITYNMGAGILRAVGNSQSPMLYQLAGGIANVALDVLFLFVFGWGIDGVAWATMLSQTLAAALALFELSHTQDAHRLCWKKIYINRGILTRIIEIGVPIGFQTMLITLSNIFVQYKINNLGVDAIAAFTAYIKVELVIYLPIVAFGQAMTTFSAQNIGAGKIDRMIKGTRICILMGTALAALSSVLMLAVGHSAFAAFNNDPGVIEDGLMIIRITFPFYFLYVFGEVLGAAIRGGGKTAPPMAIVITNICVMRTLLLFTIAGLYPDIRGIAITYPLTWASTALCMAMYYFKGRWHYAARSAAPASKV